MAPVNPIYKKAAAICLALPDTKLTMTWGSPHFRVLDKIFAGFGEQDGECSLGFKLQMDHAAARVASDPRFTRAAYVGHKGWVDLRLDSRTNWDEVSALVLESYRLIASKKTLLKLASESPGEKIGGVAGAKEPKNPKPAKSKPVKSKDAATRNKRASE